MKILMSAVLIFVFSSSLIAAEQNRKELEEYRLASLAADASSYRILEAILNHREDKIISAVVISMQVDLGTFTMFWNSIEKDKIAPDVKTLLTVYNDKLSKMIVTHPDFFKHDNVFSMLPASLLFDLPMSESNRTELSRFVHDRYSAEEMKQTRSKIQMYKIKFPPPLSYEMSILIANLCFEKYGDLLQMIDLLQQGNRDAARVFSRNKLAYINLQIEMMIAASPALASGENYQNYLKNEEAKQFAKPEK